MGKPRQRAVDIPGLQHQSGRCGSRASGRTSKEPIADGERPTAELPAKDFINSEWLLDRTDHRVRTTSPYAGRWREMVMMRCGMPPPPQLRVIFGSRRVSKRGSGLPQRTDIAPRE